MRARLTLANGTEQVESDRTFTTGAIPSGLVPSFSAQGDTSGGRGIQMINLTYPNGQNTDDKAEAVATDLSGNVIWYYQHDASEGTLFPVKLLANGHLLVGISDLSSKSVMREVDLAGNTIKELTVQDLNAALKASGFNHTLQYFHHDLQRLSNGHTLIMFAESRQISNLIGLPGATQVIGDGVVDVDANYKPVWLWSSFDHLDVNRHPLSPPPDWTHANAVSLTRDGDLLFSMRNQHWVIKINYQHGTGNGDVIWTLGAGGDFTINTGNAADWFYGQHYPNIISTTGSVTRMAIFDDGNDRPLDDGSKCNAKTTCYSRAVIYDVDEAAKTATIVWQDLPNLYTFWGGSINTPPDGNIVYDLPAPSALPGSRVLEVDQTTDPQVLWQMDVSVPYAYRAVRLRSLYPGVQW